MKSLDKISYTKKKNKKKFIAEIKNKKINNYNIEYYKKNSSNSAHPERGL